MPSADAPDELKVDFHASQEAARKWKVGAAAGIPRFLQQSKCLKLLSPYYDIE
jgi:hypothetical protein